MRKLLSAVLALCLLVTTAAASGLLIDPYRYGGGSPPASLAIAATNSYFDATGSTTHNVNLPSGIASGNLLMVFCEFNATSTVTDPSGWAVTLSAVNTDTWRIYSRIANGSEGSTVAVTLSNAQRAACLSYRITGNRNGVTSSEIEVSSAVNATTATPDPPSLSPAWGSAENLWFAVAFVSDGNYGPVTAYPTNYSLSQLDQGTTTGGNGGGVTIGVRLLTASSEDPGTFTTTTSRIRSTYTLAVRPQ